MSVFYDRALKYYDRIATFVLNKTDMTYRLLSREEYNDLSSRILYEDNHIICARTGHYTLRVITVYRSCLFCLIHK